MVEKIRSPKLVIVKVMTVNKKTGIVHNFFDNMKYMEMGGAISPGSLTKGNDGWWTFYHNIAGVSRMKYISDLKFRILDHIFIGGGLEWHVFVRILQTKMVLPLAGYLSNLMELAKMNLKNNLPTFILKLVIGSPH